MEVEAEVALHHEGILDVIAIEGYGILTNRRGEGILQHAYLIVVDVDIGKDVLDDGIQDVARLDKVVDTCRVHALDDGLLVVGLLTVDFLRHSLIDADGEDELVVIGAGLYLIDQPRALAELRRGIELLRLEVVEGKGDLLVLVVLIEVVVGEVGKLLGGHHLLHHLDSGVVLTTIATTLGLDGNLLEHLIIGLEAHPHDVLGRGVDQNGLRHIAYSRERELPTVMAGDGVVAFDIGHHADVMAFVLA